MKCIPPVALPLPSVRPFRTWTRQEIRSYTPSDCRNYRVHHWKLLCEGWPANRDDVLVWAWRFCGHEIRRAIRGDAATKRYWIDRIEDFVFDDFMRRFPRLAEKADRENPYPALCRRIRLCIWDAQRENRRVVSRFRPYAEWHSTVLSVPPRPERRIMFRDDWDRLTGRLRAMFLSPRVPRDRDRVLAFFDGKPTVKALPGYFSARLRGFVSDRVRDLFADAPRWAYDEDTRTALDALRPDESEYGIYATS